MPERSVDAIRMIILDADGVLTDGGLYFDDHDRELKRFDIHDGLGMRLWLSVGLKIGVITGRGGGALRRRLEEFGIEHYAEGVKDKVVALKSMAAAAGVGLHEIAYMGDDLPDIPAFRVVGYAMAPDNAQWEVKLSAHYHARNPGGHGAVREAIDWLLKRKGLTQAARDKCVPGLIPQPESRA